MLQKRNDMSETFKNSDAPLPRRSPTAAAPGPLPTLLGRGPDAGAGGYPRPDPRAGDPFHNLLC